MQSSSTDLQTSSKLADSAILISVGVVATDKQVKAAASRQGSEATATMGAVKP